MQHWAQQGCCRVCPPMNFVACNIARSKTDVQTPLPCSITRKEVLFFKGHLAGRHFYCCNAG